MPDFRATPTLQGRYVRLEALTPEHADGVLGAADSDEVFRWLSFGRPGDPAAARELVDLYLGNPALSAWAQIDVASGRVAGLTTYYDIDPVMRSVAIGYTWLGSAHWRSGLNTEAKLLLLTRAFEELHCVRVVWHTDDLNQRSKDAIARLGAQWEGTMRRHKRRPDGSWRDTALFSMMDDEWPAARAALSARLDH